VKVNGEQEAFHLIQPFLSAILVPIAGHLGHSPSDRDLEGIAKAAIEEIVSIGRLDDWPASLPLRLPSIDDRNMGTLVDNARQRGWIR
jgi:hypothetical protein